MIREIGQLVSGNGETLLKMWSVFVDPGRRMLRQHSHTRFELVLVRHGSGRYTTADREWPMEPGDMFVFSSNEFHCISQAGDTGMEIINLHFEPGYLLEDGENSLAQHHAGFCFSHDPKFENRIPADKAVTMRQFFQQMATELELQKPEYGLSVRSILNLLLIHLLREHGYQSSLETQPHFPGIVRAMAYIEAHLSEPLTLAEIAGVAGVSPNYFSTLFRKICNLSLWDYITARRVEKSIRMICEDSGQTMLEIALACGFNNTANFNKAFRRQTGLTPSGYRKNQDRLLS